MTATPSRVTAPIPWRIVETLTTPDTGRVTVTGDIDLATAPLLGLRLLTMMSALRPAVIVVDLAEVTFLDCAGVGVLVAVRNAGERIGCQIRISHPQPLAARILDILHLLGPFTAAIKPPQPPASPAAVEVLPLAVSSTAYARRTAA